MYVMAVIIAHVKWVDTLGKSLRAKMVSGTRPQ